MTGAIIFFDAGHGGKDSGAVGTLNGQQVKEEDITLNVVKYAEAYLLDHYEIKDSMVLQSRTNDTTISLGERTNAANKADADIFVSVHVNSAENKSAEGFETFVYPNPDSATRELQSVIHSQVFAVCKEFGITKDRGKKQENFHVLRETYMPAILIELGFISNADEVKILLSAKFQKKVGEAIAIACAKVTDLKKKPTTSTVAPVGTVYQVVTGSYRDRSNADNQVARLKKAGFDSFIQVKK